MNMAIERDAKAMWIVNVSSSSFLYTIPPNYPALAQVGDLKPYEMNIEFFITLGYDRSRFNPNNLNSYVAAWAAREFSVSTAETITISSIIANLTRFNARRKPEVLNTTLYSLINYREYVIMNPVSSLSTEVDNPKGPKTSCQPGRRCIRLRSKFTTVFHLRPSRLSLSWSTIPSKPATRLQICTLLVNASF